MSGWRRARSNVGLAIHAAVVVAVLAGVLIVGTMYGSVP